MTDTANEKNVDERQREFSDKLKRQIALATLLCVLAILAGLFPFIPGIKPPKECTGAWFQRGGAVMTAMAVYAQSKAGSLLEMIRGGTFAESWLFYFKYKGAQSMIATVSVVLVIIGTLIWGYGDLLIAPYIQACNR